MKQLLVFFDLLDDLGNEKGEYEQADGEENLGRNQLCPISRGPDFLHRPDEKGKDVGAGAFMNN